MKAFNVGDTVQYRADGETRWAIVEHIRRELETRRFGWIGSETCVLVLRDADEPHGRPFVRSIRQCGAAIPGPHIQRGGSNADSNPTLQVA